MAPSDIIKKYFRPGVVLSNRYQIEKLVGAGAYSAIFSAIDSANGTRVAIKAVPPLADGGKKTSIGRFQREMRVIGKLLHPNIISLYDFGETDERIGFMVIEFIKGHTLFDIVDGSPMTDLCAIDVTRQIAMALDVAHSQGVVHRDLKPQNVMLIQRGENDYLVKVLDFGMAKLTRRFNPDESIEELTREGIAVGTPRYIAPEQARGKQVGGYSDLYALGLLMYEMFTGERAVKADTVESAIRAHVSSTPHEFTELHDVPEQMHNILFRLTAKKVSRRYQTAAELINDLNQAEAFFRSADRTIDDRFVEHVDDSMDDPTIAYDFKNSKRRQFPAMQHPNRAFTDTSSVRSDSRTKRDSEFSLPRRADRRFDDSGNQTILIVISVILFPIAFFFATAFFHQSHYLLKLFIGCLPLSLCGFSFLFQTKFNPLKILIVVSSIAIFLAHIVEPSQLGSGLFRSSNWFLIPFSEVPGVPLISELIVDASRSYLEFLVSISKSFSPR